jgi:glycosyltransferase involved in cell wall biosynthesis
MLGNVKTGPSMLKLFLDLFVLLRAVGLLITRRYDIVHAHEEAVFFCRFLKPLFRFKLIYDMHSSLPQQLSNFNYTDSRLIYRVFKWLEDSSINASDAVITICPDLADYVDGVIKKKEQHYLIENSIFEPVRLKGKVSDRTVQDASQEPMRETAGSMCFVYAGTLEHYQGIGLMIDAFREVIACEPRARLLIVGGTHEQVEKYCEQARKVGVAENCEFTGRVPQQVANNYTKRATVLVSPRTEGTNTPLKIYQQLASGIPLVATNIYSHTQVLTKEVAFLAEPEPSAFARAMLDAARDSVGAGEKVAAALKLYDDQYSRKSYVEKLSQMLEGLR